MTTAHQPQRLRREPDSGRVVIAHVSGEAEAVTVAAANDCDYLLSYVCRPGSVHVMDCNRQAFRPSAEFPWYEPRPKGWK